MHHRFSILFHFFIVLSITGAFACKVPVYDYAKKFWNPDRFAVGVFYSGLLTKEQKSIIDNVELQNSRDSIYAIFRIDVTKEIPMPFRGVWNVVKDGSLPMLVMLYPDEVGVPDRYAFKSEITAELDSILFSSSLNKFIASQYDNQSINFWVMAHFGSEAKGAEIENMFLKEKNRVVKKLSEQVFKLAMENVIEKKYAGLKVKAPFCKLDLSSSQNTLLHSYLKNLFPKLFAKKTAFILPVYGRGRALGYIDRENIYYSNIYKTAEFLIGPCSCQLKSGNPGFDLPIPINWNNHLKHPVKSVEIGAFGQILEEKETEKDSDRLRKGDEITEVAKNKKQFLFSSGITLSVLLFFAIFVLFAGIISWVIIKKK